jgi:hydrogenase maturation protein HypF
VGEHATRTADAPVIAAASHRRSVRIEVRGTVQGVGFRPYVYRLAAARGLCGDVCNTDGRVVIRVSGPATDIATFLAGLATGAPPAAHVTGIVTSELPPEGVPAGRFRVRESAATGTTGARELPPDLATCPACLAELFDPADRRYRYPFLNCTDCGPRATIIDDLPYDRVRTTMADFPLCGDCAAEYHDPADRRFHAEPVACPRCGPRLWWLPSGTAPVAVHEEDALAAAVTAVARGGLVAVKGIGGYQLICDAGDEAAVARLRAAKHRPTKPLAVMVADLAAARTLAHPSPAEEDLLTTPARPIVLARKRADAAGIGGGACAGVPEIGLFLPYSPLHHMLFDALRRPLVVTSGNRSGEPIVIHDRTALDTLGPLVDGVLGHDRPIRSRYDDSVARVVAGRTSVVRRARGYAPAPLPLPVAAPEPVLAVGAQLKHTVTVAVGGQAMIGPHTGDLEDAATYDAFTATVQRLCRWQAVEPAVVAHDLHPQYLSTQYATRRPARRRIGVQHHHAHVAAVAAEHGLTGPFLGVAYDGLGMGDDGTLWGGEVLLATYTGYRRLARFARAPLPCGRGRRPPAGPHGPGLSVRRRGPRRPATGPGVGRRPARPPRSARGGGGAADGRTRAQRAARVERRTAVRRGREPARPVRRRVLRGRGGGAAGSRRGTVR